jgi:hypothetical protein
MALLNLFDDRQFIITNERLAGLAPAVAQPGDYVAVFAGGRTLLILRLVGQDDKSRNRYCVIGDCFVHGVMYGEFFESLKNGSWEWKTLS